MESYAQFQYFLRMLLEESIIYRWLTHWSYHIVAMSHRYYTPHSPAVISISVVKCVDTRSTLPLLYFSARPHFDLTWYNTSNRNRKIKNASTSIYTFFSKFISRVSDLSYPVKIFGGNFSHHLLFSICEKTFEHWFQWILHDKFNGGIKQFPVLPIIYIVTNTCVVRLVQKRSGFAVIAHQWSPCL